MVHSRRQDGFILVLLYLFRGRFHLFNRFHLFDLSGGLGGGGGGRRWWRRGLRDGCGRSGGRWCDSVACGGWLTRCPPALLRGYDLFELLLGFLRVLLDTEARLKNRLATNIRVLEQAMGTGNVGRGETIPEELTGLLPRAAGAGLGRRGGR